MATSKKRVTVPGSEKRAMPNARVIGEVDPVARIEVTVVLRPRTSGAGALKAKAATAAAMTAGAKAPARAPVPEPRAIRGRARRRPQGRRRDRRLRAPAQPHRRRRQPGQAQHPPRRHVQDLTAAFQAKLKQTKVAGRAVRARTGGISVPGSPRSASRPRGSSIR